MNDEDTKSSPVFEIIAILVGVLILFALLESLPSRVDIAELAARTLQGAPSALACFVFIAVVWIVYTHVRFSRRVLLSTVSSNPGLCFPVWTNKQPFDKDTPDIFTGIFRPATRIAGTPFLWLNTQEFHGAMQGDRVLSVLEVLSATVGQAP